MGVAITLRNKPQKSFFKNMLIGLLHGTDADELLLCTGYLQYLSIDTHGNKTTYNVFLDEDTNKDTLLDAICSYKMVTLVGIKADKASDWYRQYKEAIDFLRSEIKKRNSKTKLSCYYRSSGKWHAKVAILLRNTSNKTIPIAAIVGSSNLTRPPMHDSDTPKNLSSSGSLRKLGYNIEGDTLIYVNKEAGDVVEQQLSTYVDMENGEIISFSGVPHIYGNNKISTEGDVIMAEYDEIIRDINASGNYTKL